MTCSWDSSTEAAICLLLRNPGLCDCISLKGSGLLYCYWCCCLLCTTRDPERGWDHSRVKGVVAKLVRVKDPAAATALEVAAGGRLYQVGRLECAPSSGPCCNI